MKHEPFRTASLKYIEKFQSKILFTERITSKKSSKLEKILITIFILNIFVVEAWNRIKLA